MVRHQASGHFGRGLALASCTMLLWGMLPLALEQLLGVLDPVTITGFRFGASALVLLHVLAFRGALPDLAGLAAGRLGLLLVATVFLAANYWTYLLGLERTDAPTSQVLIQAAPILLALGGLVFFHERFRPAQWLGLAILTAGMAGFFWSQVRALADDFSRYLDGSLFMAVAAVSWAIYGLAQKQLLLWLGSQAIMLCIYVGCALLFALGSDYTSFAALDAVQWAILVFVAANTLVGYGTFAAALEHWEASRVSAVLALTPLATLVFTLAAAALWPDQVDARTVRPETFVWAGVVVAGSVLVALAGPSGPTSAHES